MSEEKYGFPKGTTFLITGGAGFIGSNLVEKILNLGYQVRVLDNFSTGKEKNIAEFTSRPNFHFIKGDIRNLSDCEEACENIDYVLHQAALGSVPRSINDPKTTNEVNINGTLNMMIAARDQEVKKFVYASSSSVYGDEFMLPKIENKIGIPLSPYAVTKIACENYGKNFYMHYGLPTIGLRYFNVFGKKQDTSSAYAAVIPKFVKKILRGEAPIIFGDGEQSRDFTYIDNVVEANLKACSTGEDAFGKVFNIACEDRVTINELCRKLSSKLEIHIDPIYVSERLGDVKHSKADIKMAREILGYDPKYDFDTGLTLALDWYKSNL